MVVESSQVEGCSVLVAKSVYFGISFDQGASRLEVSDVGCVMERGPPIWINIVDVGVTVVNNCLEGVGLHIFGREHSLVDWRFTKNGFSVINFAATIDKVLNVTVIGLLSGFVQILKHIPSEFIFANV
jgi:hypothetical protein